MSEETARYLASYLREHMGEFMTKDKYGEEDIDDRIMNHVILRFFEELP